MTLDQISEVGYIWFIILTDVTLLDAVSERTTVNNVYYLFNMS
jgi:hypothetical protein